MKTTVSKATEIVSMRAEMQRKDNSIFILEGTIDEIKKSSSK